MQFLCVISQDSDQSAFGESILKMAHESFFLGWSVNSKPKKASQSSILTGHYLTRRNFLTIPTSKASSGSATYQEGAFR